MNKKHLTTISRPEQQMLVLLHWNLTDSEKVLQEPVGVI